MTFFYDFTLEELQARMRHEGLTPASAGLVFNWHYKMRRRAPCQHHNLPRKTADFLRTLKFDLPAIAEVREAPDRTVKFLFELADGARVETVLIPFQDKYSVCLSSQVGCAMACAFCHTGVQGFKRQLRTHEIVGQLLGVQAWLTRARPGDDRILNLVYMGQGEPLHNLAAVGRSAKIFMCQHGLSLAGHKITVSTSGYLPGLKNWRREMPDVNIALSLHSPFDHKRSELIPINQRYPLTQVLPLVEAIPTGKKRFVTYEYLLAADFNDGEIDARATAQLLAGKKALINLIPFNPYPGARYRRPEPGRVLRFKQILDEAGLPTMIRKTKGDEILAACGQLNSRAKNCSTGPAN